MLRVDFHHHIDTDPVDGHFVAHTGAALIDQAAAAGLNALAITCHESIPYDGELTRYAAEKGIVLIKGMEASVNGTHVLLINFQEFPAGQCTMADIAAAKSADSLVIAPHPFYPSKVAGRIILEEHTPVFDAVEFSGLYTPLTKIFNRRAVNHARRSSLPVVGNTDTHFLWQLGRTYTEVDAEPNAAAIVEAVRAGRTRLVTKPLKWTDILRFAVDSKSTVLLARDALMNLGKVVRRTRRAAATTAPSIS